MVTALDQAIGDLHTELENQGLLENAIIVFTSDVRLLLFWMAILVGKNIKVMTVILKLNPLHVMEESSTEVIVFFHKENKHT